MTIRLWRRKTLFPGLRMNLSMSGIACPGAEEGNAQLSIGGIKWKPSGSEKARF